MKDQVLIEVSLLWKTRYLDYCITATKTCCKKSSHYKGQACIVDIEMTPSLQEHIFRMDGFDIWYDYDFIIFIK